MFHLRSLNSIFCNASFEFENLQWRNLSKDEKQVYKQKAQNAIANLEPAQQAIQAVEQ
jgi:hypothetical protein